MFRTRLFFFLLLVAHLGLTPLGIYTCACILPEHSVTQDAQHSANAPDSSTLAQNAAAILSYVHSSLLIVALGLLAKTTVRQTTFWPAWLASGEFKPPTLTPPPQLA